MPKVFDYKGYSIYFWSNENGEPVHIHVSKGKPSVNATKMWLTSAGGVLTINSSKYPSNDIAKIEKEVIANYHIILRKWDKFFGCHTFYC